jgi:uncharacterized protein (DUF1499 family)
MYEPAMKVGRILLLGALVGGAQALVSPASDKNFPPTSIDVDTATGSGSSMTRRGVLSFGLTGLLFLRTADSAIAFDNKIDGKWDGQPKRRGSQAKDLGILPRKDLVGEEYMGLKHCGAAPNCFSSTDFVEDDPDHSIPAWVWPKEFGDDKEKAFAQLADVIDAYKPGQSGIDGGGFKIFKNDPKNGYIYTQFESYKNGFIDDLELAWIDGLGERAVQVRSSSRLGYLDYGVNAKRLNYIAKDLRAKGWDAKGVDFDTHQNYAIENGLI